MEDDDSGGEHCSILHSSQFDPVLDEMDGISTRTLALTRYKRNHDLMNEVFVHAAFG